MSEEMKNLLPVELKERIDYLSGQEIGHNGIYYVQDAGEKVAGKLYMCKTMKKIFRCKADNTLTYIDDSKYESMSLETLLDKLQNLYKVHTFQKLGSTALEDTIDFKNIINVNLDIINKASFITIDISIPTNIEFTTHTFPISRLLNGLTVVIADSYHNTTVTTAFESIEIRITTDGWIQYRNNNKTTSKATSIVDNSIGNIFIY